MPYPSSPQSISMELGFQLQQVDPELFAVVSGAEIPATLELAVMDGSLPDEAATPQQRQQEANAAQVQAILDRNGGNPYGVQGYYQNPDDANSYIAKREKNLTDSMLLESLDPQLAAQMELQANPPQAAPGALSAADAAWVNAEAQRIASLNMIGGN